MIKGKQKKFSNLNYITAFLIMRPLRQVKAPYSLVATVINVSSAAQLLLSHHITKTDGKNSMISNQHDRVTEPLLMVIKSLSSEDREQSKLNRFGIANFILNISDTQRFGAKKMEPRTFNWPILNCTTIMSTQNYNW